MAIYVAKRLEKYRLGYKGNKLDKKSIAKMLTD